MAEVNAVANERAQLAAIAELRWRLFVNSLRSRNGKQELGARVFIVLLYGASGLGAAIGLASSAYISIADGKPASLAILLWPVMVAWQVLPIMVSSLSDNFDLSGLLRFPLAYRSYVLVRLLYGLMDVGTILGTLCLLGMLIGIAAANPALLLPGAVVLLTFAVLNVLLSRMVFAWIERWLAQRRTRELMGGLFVLLLLSLQLINPIMQHYSDKSTQQTIRWTRNLSAAIAGQRFLPPGMVAAALEDATAKNYTGTIGFTACMLLYTIGVGSLLSSRLHAQYNGENLSESGAPNTGRAGRFALNGPSTRHVKTADQPARGHSTSAPIMAIMQKEFRYLMRSGPLLITLLTPVFMLIVLGSQWRGGDAYRFPAGMAYTTLVLANIIYNCFGTDGSGVQMYLTAPVRMSTVVLAKNLTSVCILLVQTAITFAAVALIYRLPSVQIVAVTLTWLLFSMPINLAIGSRLSLQSPRKMNFERFGRQQSSTLNALSSLGIQVITMGCGATVLYLLRRDASLWPATAIFAALAALSFSAYLILLNRVDQVALKWRDTLTAELCKP